MQVLQNRVVQEYVSSLNGKNPVFGLFTGCRCIDDDHPSSDDGHVDPGVLVSPVSHNLVELAANQGPKDVRLVGIYVTKQSYFNGDTMKFLIDRMLAAESTETVEYYYSALDKNFTMHPPCAQYMKDEYEKMMLAECKKYFKHTCLWDYLLQLLNLVTNGTFVYGENEVFDVAFKRCFSFCANVFQINFEVAQRRNYKPLIMTCLKYNPMRTTRMSEISKLLDRLFNTGYNFQMPVVSFAILIDRMMKLNWKYLQWCIWFLFCTRYC